MAAFVLVAPRNPTPPRSGERLNIFPGSATPVVFAAGMPFWVGYGFIPDPGKGIDASVHDETGFELLVDGEAVPLHTELDVEGSRVARKFTVADFPAGLPAGWHHFGGRWYDAGLLALASNDAIEFVER